MNVRTGLKVGLAAMVVSTAAAVVAAGPGAVRKQVEASMLVTGKISVDAAGKVTGFTLDEKDKLPPGVVGIIDKSVPTWKFEPVTVGGQPAHATTDMSIRLVARKLDADNYTIAIRAAGFGDAADKYPRPAPKLNRADDVGDKVCKTGLTPPRYPETAARSGVASNVYLLLKTSSDGKVLDVIAEQVNLKVVSDENSMTKWRRTFADVALRQARTWCLEPPKGEPDTKSDFFVVRVPVTFHLDKLPAYGRWEAYVPGPRQANPWKSDEEGLGFNPDTLAPGRAYVVGSGLKLLTSLSET